MKRLSRLSENRLIAGLAALTLSAGLVVSPAVATVTTAGAMVPAIGTHPDYKVVGRAQPNDPVFSCQVTTPAECYGPKQIRTAYGIDKIKGSGAGQTIVIVDAYQSPTIQHDLDLFDSVFGLANTQVQIIAPDGLTPFDQNDANMTGWAGEITLDVEWAHAIAPGAQIRLVLAKSNNDPDIFSVTKYAVDHNLGDVISQSFGEAEACFDPTLMVKQHKLFQQATKRGITLLASSGDQGSAQPTCDNSSFSLAASTPASDPLVTAVGGTLLDADGLTGAYHNEVTWNEPVFAAAGGGGFSSVYTRPAYQKGMVSGNARGVPDVAYNAGIDTSVLAVWSTSGLGANLLFGFGGTSAGSPQWAGLVALADQLNGGQRVGALNDTLYKIAKSGHYSTDFHDITVGDNTYHGVVTVPGFSAGPGWDAATGLGTPIANKLVPALIR
jgi:subtilase family serine protease